MRPADALVLATVLASSVAFAEPLSLTPTFHLAPDVEAASAAPSLQPSRSARLLAESLTVAGAGVVAPLGAYLAITSLNSFVGFFAGFLTGTGIGALLAPLAVILVGRALGAEGGVGRAVVGALLGLVAGLLIGLPLATIPGAGYLLGLGLLWVLPSVGTLVAFEWGRAPPPGDGGLVVARF